MKQIIFASIIASVFAQLDTAGVHISWAQLDSEMFVTWATNSTDIQEPTVQWASLTGPDAGVNQEAVCTLKQFYNKRGHSSSRQFNVWHGKMINLSPGEKYEYRVGDKAQNLWTEKFTFSAKRTFEGEAPAKFIVYGDFGVGDPIVDTVNRLKQDIETNQFDAILHVGDAAYNLNSDDGYRADLFFNSIQPIAAQIPYMFVQGNHEGPEHHTVEHFNNLFQMPGETNYWYSFNAGLFHIVGYSTEIVIEPEDSSYPYDNMVETQTEWLKNDLSSVNRTQTPWVVTIGHHPFYCSADWTVDGYYNEYDDFVPWERHNKDCVTLGPEVRAVYEDLMYQHKVDLMLFGHVHSYERMAPAYKNQTVPSDSDGPHYHYNPKAPIEIIGGIPGQQESNAPISVTPLPFSIYQTSELGYGHLQAFNSTHLYWEQLRDWDDYVIDWVWIIKPEQFI